MNTETKDEGVLYGYLMACQNLVHLYDQPTMAAQLIREGGFKKDALLWAQKNTDFETEKMNKVIRDAFK